MEVLRCIPVDDSIEPSLHLCYFNGLRISSFRWTAVSGSYVQLFLHLNLDDFSGSQLDNMIMTG